MKTRPAPSPCDVGLVPTAVAVTAKCQLSPKRESKYCDSPRNLPASEGSGGCLASCPCVFITITVLRKGTLLHVKISADPIHNFQSSFPHPSLHLDYDPFKSGGESLLFFASNKSCQTIHVVSGPFNMWLYEDSEILKALHMVLSINTEA